MANYVAHSGFDSKPWGPSVHWSSVKRVSLPTAYTVRTRLQNKTGYFHNDAILDTACYMWQAHAVLLFSHLPSRAEFCEE